MFTYKEALDEHKRMVEFREKHWYNSKPCIKEPNADISKYEEPIERDF